MLKSEKFFGKRDANAPAGSLTSAADKPGLVVATPATVTGPRVVPASIASPASGSFTNAGAASAGEARSKLTVGPNIKLKGVEITDCDTLLVEGRVEATIDSRVVQISERGAFIGNAEFDIAEIRGEFEGELTVRQKLVVYSTGRVTGKVRYGKLVIEEGGQLTGDVQLSGSGVSNSASNNVKGLTVAVGNG